MKKLTASLLTLLMMVNLCVSADSDERLDRLVQTTGRFLVTEVKAPDFGSVGGEWAVIGLARSGHEVSTDYFDDYYSRIMSYVSQKDGNLNNVKYTEYSRLILALTAIGQDPTDVDGYNLLLPLADYEKTVWQGINGPVWALIALDSGSYDLPYNEGAEVQATRDLYIQRILDRQLPDGGFSLLGGTASASEDEGADPDVTGMVLQALAGYQDRADVANATQRALAVLSALQNDQGGYSLQGEMNAESCVQVIIALTEHGIGLEDSRFVKNGFTLLDNLKLFFDSNGGFVHSLEGGSVNLMTSEQALMALAALDRQAKGEKRFYDMADVVSVKKNKGTGTEAVTGLKGRHEAIQVKPIVNPGITFRDITGHPARKAIEGLAERAIINGKSSSEFDPDATMTRAEFATIVIKAFGLAPEATDRFKDVIHTSWYAGYVGAANSYGIVNGKSAEAFDPAGTITREEAAVMIARAADLAGMDTGMETVEVRDVLAQFPDYVQVSEWARNQTAFCYREGILAQSDLEIRPDEAVKRYEVAVMLYKMLEKCKLL